MATHIQPERLVYRINDACHVLGVGRSSLYKIAAEGKIKLIRIAGRSVVTAESLRSFVESQ
jgi:excisionase family DNA binding protein